MTLLKRGDRVRVVGELPNDPDPLTIGLEGTVVHVMNPQTTIEQIVVDWDTPIGASRRSLMLLPGDPFEVIPPKRATRTTRSRSTSTSKTESS